MRTDLPGLFAAGEAVGGANGANRLSGNAVTEALVFGRRAGQQCRKPGEADAMPAVGQHEAGAALDLVASDPPPGDTRNTAAMIDALQATMSDNVGPLRDAPGLVRALETIAELTAELGERPAGDAKAFDMRRLEWFDLRNMLLVARLVAEAALARRESRGAHQREDFPDMLAGMAASPIRLPRRRANGARLMSLTATLVIRRGIAGPERSALGELHGAVRAGPVGARRAALDTQPSRSDPGGALFLHQRQCLQGMHDRTRRQDGLRLHRAARSPGHAVGSARQQEARARPRHRDRSRRRSAFRGEAETRFLRRPPIPAARQRTG